jgi:hypothetical protein
MRKPILSVVAVVLVAAIGLTAYTITTPSTFGSLTGTGAKSTQSASGGTPLTAANCSTISSGSSGCFQAYDCSLPAVVSDLACATLPVGYVIPPKLPNAPASPPRPAYMTDAAYALLTKTYGNGICDPNETFLTSPLDCAAYGAVTNDPFTGRPGAPAIVCFAAVPENPVGY